MKTLKFRHILVKEVLDGKKISTWRLFDDKNLTKEDLIELIDWESKEKFADAIILEIKEKKLSEIEDSDFEGHEKFESKDIMLETYKKYYGDKVDWDTIVKMITFKLL